MVLFVIGIQDGTLILKVAALIKEDYLIRDHLMEVYKNGSVSHVEIERLKGREKNRVRLRLHTAKPGVVIGRDAENKKKLKLI